MILLIAGDLAPTKSNIDLFNHADTKALLGEELLSNFNFRQILRSVNFFIDVEYSTD